MKYLEEPVLSLINSQISLIECSDRIYRGRIEAYSCKKQKEDRAYAKALEEQIISDSNNILSSSPFGDMKDVPTRKLLINLISTLNSTFPDYDFSSVTPESFVKIRSLSSKMLFTEWNEMLQHLQSRNTFSQNFWKAIDSVMNSKAHPYVVYRYTPEEGDDNPLTDGTLWSLNYFFVSQELKKIVFLTCNSKSKMYEHDEGRNNSEGGFDDDRDDYDDDDDDDLASTVSSIHNTAAFQYEWDDDEED